MREELDFKSLRFFSALYRLGNVSPAADALNISQPTGSLLLKKLRDHFADPLFVRVGVTIRYDVYSNRFIII